MPEFEISNRTKFMTESATLKMAQMARELGSKGIDIINLSLGEPDFDTPDHIKNAAKIALDKGYTKYTPVSGTLELRNAISEKFLKENKLNYPPNQIIVSNGAKQSFANLCFAMLNEGDQVLIFSPYWVSYYEIVKLAGGVPICIDSTVENNYKPSIDELKSKLSPSAKMLVFSSPCNPTGTFFNKKNIEDYVEVLADFPNLLVVSDEIYELIIFDTEHISIGSFPDMIDRTVTINGFSKGFSMTGWRLGYMGGPKTVIDACTKIQGQFTSGACSFNQYAGITALTSDLEPSYKMRDEFKKRRDLCHELLQTIPGWIVNKPEGAFYFLPQVNFYFGKSFEGMVIQNSDDLALYLLNYAHTALVSGSAFGAPDCLRISYSLSQEKLKLAIQRIKDALAKLT